MRQIISFFLAMLITGSALGEWLLLGRTDAFRMYVDSKSIEPNADSDTVQLWQLMDFTSAQWADAQTAVGSIKTLIEHDCAEPRSRALLVEAFSEQMGDGHSVARERATDPPWELIQPGSPAEKTRQLACDKR